MIDMNVTHPKDTEVIANFNTTARNAGRDDIRSAEQTAHATPFLPLSDLSNNVLRDTTQKANT